MSKSTDKEMSFLDHLEELRWHLVRSTIAIFLVAIVAFTYQTFIYENFLLAHLQGDFVTYQFFCDTFSKIGINSDFCNVSFDQKLQALAPTKQLMNAIWSSLILGFIVAFPYVLWEMMRFITPGLTSKEKRSSKVLIFFASLLLILGLLFSYYVIVPMSVYFFYNYSISDLITNSFQFDSYISLVTNTLLGVSLIFELPLVIYFLSKIGLITPQFLKTYRKHALVLVLIVSAIITPPDVASQIIVTIPVLFLYEISIYISGAIQKKKELN